ncbi:MAG: hypothetical protein ACLU84_04160 [Clostridia bacterium]
MKESTSVGSNKKTIATIVGGEEIPLENGEIVMPPENAKDMKDVCNQLWNDYVIEISTIDGALEMGKYSIPEIKRLEEERKTRRTKQALERRQREEGQQNKGNAR